MLYATGADGNLHFVDDVENGLACACTCPACGQPLIARNGGTKLIHHFAHRTSACAWAIEAIVSGLAADALRDAGRIRLPALDYHDAERDVERVVSGPLTMAVAEVAEEAISGRGVPDILVTVSARSTTRTFALVCTLTHRLTEAECARLMERLPGVLALDLASDLRRRRAELGKHYDRVEVLRSYQDPELVRACLSDEDGLLVWAANERAATLERESEERLRAELERRRKADERREREREERERRNAERDAERSRRRAEEERDRRERRRAEREAERDRKRREQAAREELERQEAEELHRLTEELVAAREVVRPVEIPHDPEALDASYDVRTWPELTRLPRGILCSFGCMRALVSERDGRRRHSVLTDLRPFEVREVAGHLAELKGVADEISVVLVAEMAYISQDIVAVHAEQGITWFEVMTPALLDALGPLDAIFSCGVPVTVNFTRGAGGRLLAVMPDRGLIALEAKNASANGS